MLLQKNSDFYVIKKHEKYQTIIKINFLSVHVVSDLVLGSEV